VLVQHPFRSDLRRGVAALAVALLAAGPASAQRGPDLNTLALDWSRGRYLSPLICEIEGELVRGGRRLLIAPGPRHARPPVNRLRFLDLDAEDASRCFNELGGDEPNVEGDLQFRLEGIAHPETARRDFAAAMRREGGFTFHVPEGRLRIQEVGSEESRVVDFRGGSVRLARVAPGSDDARRLGDLKGLRTLVLELEGPDGMRLRFPLLMTELR